MQLMRRPIRRRTPLWHPHVDTVEHGAFPKPGHSVTLVMPLGSPLGAAGPVGAGDIPYVGLDPSDPVTWRRMYNPQPGMIAYLNFDGAQPNQTQTTGGRQGGLPIGQTRG